MLIHMAKLAPSGRMYYRHPSNMGSVMMYFDDPDLSYRRKVLVLDAKYRSNQRFGAFGIESENTIVRDTLFDARNNTSDKYLFNNCPRDLQSSRENCDNWMKLNSMKDNYFDRLGYTGVPAVNYCRNILVNGVPCDLPNIQILMRIWCDREVIDDLDPTVLYYPKYALSAKYNPQGDWEIGKKGSSGDTRAAYNNLAWSSTEYGSGNCWYVYCDGGVSGYGDKYNEFSVVPVLELF